MARIFQQQLETQNELLRLLRKENSNLKHDIKQLINIITSARVSGRWDIEGARFRDVTSEQVFGTIQDQHSQSLNYSSGDLRSLTDQVKHCDDTIDRLQKDLEFVTRRKQDLERQISELTSQEERSGNTTAIRESDIDEMAAGLDIKSDGEDEPVSTQTGIDELMSVVLDIKSDSEEEPASTGLEVSGRRRSTSIRPLNIQLDRQINIKHDNDKYVCCITGSTVIDTTRIAVVDYHNASVKLVDIQNNVILSYLKLESRPWDITQTDQGQLVVTCPRILSLLFINVVGNILTVDRRRKVCGGCYGFDCRNDLFIVSFVDQKLVKLIKTDGQTVQTVSTDSSGQPLFVYPQYVVFSKDNQSVYVSDFDKNSITHLDINGTVLGVYTSNDLKGPLGVTVDRHNNVYIAGKYSSNICVLTDESTQIQPVVKVDHPQSVLVYDDSDQMIVSRFYSDEIKVYKLH